jgi:hypothetical protein
METVYFSETLVSTTSPNGVTTQKNSINVFTASSGTQAKIYNVLCLMSVHCLIVCNGSGKCCSSNAFSSIYTLAPSLIFMSVVILNIGKKEKLYCCCRNEGSSGSLGSVVSGYGLDDRAIEVQPPTEAREFFL